MSWAAIALVLVTALAALGAAGCGEETSARTYRLQLDNAFGLDKASDVAIAGAPAGSITATDVDFRTHRAVVTFRLDRDDFGGLRKDVRCEVRLRSLVGDYYLDCQPGSSPTRLKTGALIPVTQSAGTVPTDLVYGIQRLPYRERFRILMAEFGAAAAGNGDNLNAAIRRLVPALRVTDEVLLTLASQREALARLTTNANTVVSALARNRRNVGRWVVKTREATGAAASRRTALAASFAKLPGFLRELTPSMVALRDAARQTTPAVGRLSAAAPPTRAFLRQVAAFSDVGQPGVRALGEAARAGLPPMRRAPALIRQLRRFSDPAADVGNNLAIVLDHLRSRDHATEPHPHTAGGKGLTGLEVPLEFIYTLSQVTNSYTARGHYIKAAPFGAGECDKYFDGELARENADKCGSFLGPTQPGVTTPDPSATGESAGRRRVARRRAGGRKSASDRTEAPGGGRSGPPAPLVDLKRLAPRSVPDITQDLPSLPPLLPLPGRTPELRSKPEVLLDYLLGP